MNKFRKTLVVIFSALFVLCMATFAAACNTSSNSDAESPEAPKAAYSVSVDVNDASLGTYTLTEANNGEGYTEGTLVTLTVKPNEGYDATLKVNGKEVALDENGAASFAVTQETQVQVDYNYKYQVYMSVSGAEGGEVLVERAEGKTGQYDPNEEVTLKVALNDGYALKQLLIDGTPVEDLAPLTGDGYPLTVDGRKYVVAEFVALHTVTVTNDEAKGAVTLTAGETPVELSENSTATLAEGTLVTVTVLPVEGETVKSINVNGTPFTWKAEGVSFEVKADTTVEVVYDTYYTVTLPELDAAAGSVTLSETNENNRYLAGTVLTLTAELNDAYLITKATVTIGEAENDVTAVLNALGRCSFTVTDNVEIAIEVKSYSEAQSYSVNVACNNGNYGEATLDKTATAPEDKYYHGTELTLTVTPEPGYKVSYVTVNGARVSLTAGTTYTFTVTQDVEIYVVFAATERYTVRVDIGALKAAGYTLTIDGNGIPAENVNDTFLKVSCYEGQTVEVVITAPAEPAQPLVGEILYSVNGGEKQLYNGTGFTLGPIDADVSVNVTVEAPAEPAVTADPDETLSAPASDYYTVDLNNASGNYIFTFKEEVPTHAEDGRTYRFAGWKVTVNDVVLTEDDLWTGASGALLAALGDDYLFAAKQAFAVAYGPEMNVTIEPVWVETFTFTVEADEHCTVEVKVGEDKVDPAENGAYVFDLGATFDVTLTPAENYRFNGISGYEGVSVPDNYAAVSFTVTNINENVTVTVEPLVQYATLQYTVVFPEDVDTSIFNTHYVVSAGETVYDAGTEYKVDVGTIIHVFNSTPAGYKATITGLKLDGFALGGTYTNIGDGSLTVDRGLLAEGLNMTITFEKLQQKVTVTAENATVTINGTQVESGSSIDCDVAKDVTVEVQANEGFTVTGVTMNGEPLEATEEGKYTFTMPHDEVELVVSTLPALTVTFPETTPEQGSTGAPVQGTWTAVDEAETTLEIGANTLVVNGEPVTTITDNDKTGGEVVYTLTTATKTYTLAWFGEVEGYILALDDTTPAGAAARRSRLSALSETTTYFVNPDHAGDEVAEEVAAKFVGTWKNGENSLVFTLGENPTQVSLDGSPVKYLFALENDQYLLVVGAAAYDFALSETAHTLTDNAAETTYTQAYKVTVTANEVAGCSYEGVTDGSLETYGSTLTLTLMLAEKFDADVVVSGGTSVKNEDGTYTVTVSADTTITITYVALHTLTFDGDTGTYTVTVENESAKGYREGTTVYFTVEANEGYTLFYVMNGDQDLEAGDDGRYSVIFGDSDITVTVGTVVEKSATNFRDAGLYLVDGTTLALAITFNSTGYDEGQLRNAYLKIDQGNINLLETESNQFLVDDNGGTKNVLYFDISDCRMTLSLPILFLAITEVEQYPIEGATVDAAHASIENNNGFNFALSTDDNKLTLTVTEAEPPVVEKKVTGVTDAILEDLSLYLVIDTQGYASTDDVKADIKLVYGTADMPCVGAVSVVGVDGRYKVQFNGIVDLNVSEEGYVLTLKVVSTGAVTENLTANANTSKTFTYNNTKDYSLSVKGEQLVLNVAQHVEQPTYTISKAELVATEDGGVALEITISGGDLNGNCVADLFEVGHESESNGFAKSSPYADGKFVIGDLPKDVTTRALVLKVVSGLSETATIELKNIGEVATTTVPVDNYVYSLTDGKDTSLTLVVTDNSAPAEVVITSMTNDVVNLTGDKTGIEICFHVRAEAGGLTEDLLKNAEIIIGSYTQSVDNRTNIDGSDGKAGMIWAVLVLASIPDGTTPIQVKIGNTTYPLKITVGYGQDKTFTPGNGKVYAVDLDAETPSITVSEALTEFTVDVVVKDKPDTVEGLGYELKNEGDTVESGKPVPAGATLTLTVTVPENYSATVKVDGATLEPGENNSYTIKSLKSNVTITITYSEVGAEPEVIDITIRSFKTESNDLKLITVDYDLEEIKTNVSYITINGRYDNLGWIGAKYQVDGSNIRIVVPTDGTFDASDFTIEWYKGGADGTGGTLWAKSHWVDTTMVPTATDGTAQNYPDKWSYFDQLNRATAKYEDDTLKFSWANRGDDTWWIIQLYYVDSKLNVGDKYTVSFTVTVTSEITDGNPLILRFFENGDFAQDIEISAQNNPVQFKSKTVTLNDLKQAIKMFVCGVDADKDHRYADASIEISNLQIEIVEQKDPRLLSASFDVDNQTVYYVVSVKTTKYTQEQLEKSELYGDNDQTNQKYKVAKVTTESDGSYKVYFDITALRTVGEGLKTFYPHLKIDTDTIGNLECGYTGSQSVTVNGVTYTFEMAYNMPSVNVTVEEVQESFTVKFSNGGDEAIKGLSGEVTVGKGESVNLQDKSVGVTKDGYTFSYWYYKTADGELKIEQDSIDPSELAAKDTDGSDLTLTLYAKFVENAETHHFPNEADENGYLVCEGCGAICKAEDVKGATVPATLFEESLTETGLSVSFYATVGDSDWAAAAISSEGLIITLPNLDSYSATNDTFKGFNKFPPVENLVNGGAWNSFLNGSSYITITIAKDAIKYYKNGVLLIQYNATDTLNPHNAYFAGLDGSTGTNPLPETNPTVGAFAETLLLTISQKGFTFASGLTDASKLFMEAKTYTVEEAKARYDSYFGEFGVSADHAHVYENGVCTKCEAVQAASELTDWTQVNKTIASPSGWDTGSGELDEKLVKGGKLYVAGSITQNYENHKNDGANAPYYSMVLEFAEGYTFTIWNNGWGYDNNGGAGTTNFGGTQGVHTLQRMTVYDHTHTEVEGLASEANMMAIASNCNYVLEFDWTDSSKVVITVRLSNTERTYVISYSLPVVNGDLANLTVKVGADHCDSVVVTCTKAVAPLSANAQDRRVAGDRTYTLKEGETITLTATVDAEEGMEVNGAVALVRLDGQNTLRFSPEGLFYNSQALQDDSSFGSYTVRSLSENELKNLLKSGATLTIEIKYFNNEISLTYKVDETSVSVVIEGASADSYVVEFNRNGGWYSSYSVVA